MRIGYCSPFAPSKTGVADFSKEVVRALAPHMELVLFSPEKIDDADLLKRFEAHPLEKLEECAVRSKLDLIVYHVANDARYHGGIVRLQQEYPGIVELHEPALNQLAAAMIIPEQGFAGYLRQAYQNHGGRGRALMQAYLAGNAAEPWLEHSMDMCMNRKILEKASGFVVHSDLVKQMVLGCEPDAPVENIMHHSEIIPDPQWKDACRSKLGLEKGRLMIGAFGLATKSKRILQTLRALKRYKETTKEDFVFYVVGEVSTEIESQLENCGEWLNVTGYVTMEQFKLYMGACDFCINLRYPTQGESSGSLHRMLGMGKPVIVTDVGAFRAYPDAAVLKIRYDENEEEDLYKAICLLAGDPIERQKRGDAALRFAQSNCDIQKNALRYKTFFESILAGTWRPSARDVQIRRLLEEKVKGIYG